MFPEKGRSAGWEAADDGPEERGSCDCAVCSRNKKIFEARARQNGRSLESLFGSCAADLADPYGDLTWAIHGIEGKCRVRRSQAGSPDARAFVGTDFVPAFPAMLIAWFRRQVSNFERTSGVRVRLSPACARVPFRVYTGCSTGFVCKGGLGTSAARCLAWSAAVVAFLAVMLSGTHNC